MSWNDFHSLLILWRRQFDHHVKLAITDDDQYGRSKLRLLTTYQEIVRAARELGLKENPSPLYAFWHSHVVPAEKIRAAHERQSELMAEAQAVFNSQAGDASHRGVDEVTIAEGLEILAREGIATPAKGTCSKAAKKGILPFREAPGRRRVGRLADLRDYCNSMAHKKLLRNSDRLGNASFQDIKKRMEKVRSGRP